jgi:hypothetical protein
MEPGFIRIIINEGEIYAGKPTENREPVLI